VEKRKEFIINMQISFGVFKKGDRQLFELTLSELEEELRVYLKVK
jgi:hypothetical protein